MSIRFKVLLMALLGFALSALLIYTVVRLVILPPFSALEHEEAQKNIARAIDALEREVQLLAPSVVDWATWDEIYRFLQDRNPGFIEANLVPSTLEHLRIDHMALYDRAGNRIWVGDRPLPVGTPVPLGDLDLPHLSGRHVLSCDDAKPEAFGLYRAGQRVLLVAAHSILTSEGVGPSRGTVLMARFVDEAAVQRIAKQTRLAVRIEVLEDPGPDAIRSVDGAPPEAIARSVVSLREHPGVTQASALLADLSGHPVLRVEVEAPRVISARGEHSVLVATGWLIGVAVALTVALLLGLRSAVVRPISKLTRHAIEVGAQGLPGDGLAFALARRDEIGVLAREFERMVQRLAELRRSLVDQSYHSGVAEMASGVMHNIGNAITPLTIRVHTLADALHRPPIAELGLALAELEQGAAQSDRRRDLEQFARLATLELIETVRQAPEQLAAVARQVEHVQQILADQEKFSRAGRAVEPIALDAVVAESLDLMGGDTRPGVTVDIDASVKRAGPVLGVRVALQQIVNNLLLNACEAIDASGRAGRITIDAQAEHSDGRSFVQLRVGDNGIGIASEQLPRLFERGFTTKARGSSGIGLHWCAVTVNALEGRLLAESAGLDQGARFALVLPAGPQTVPAGA